MSGRGSRWRRLTAVLAAAAVSYAPACARGTDPHDRVARGAYLVTIVGCHACHTPMIRGAKGFELDRAHLLAGHPETLAVAAGGGACETLDTTTAFRGPWGVSYAANLTPDRNTGLGIWTEEMFLRAMRSGRHMGQSRPILPPMPWQDLAQATDEDLKAIFAYLRSIAPVTNHVPDPTPAAGDAASGASP